MNVTEKFSYSLYVDDLRTGKETIQGVYELYYLAKQVMSEGGFHLRKWNSHSTHLRRHKSEKMKPHLIWEID